MIRPWDFMLTKNQRDQVQIRRIHPDGAPVKVSRKKVGGHLKNKYPWETMRDGDFFIVPVGESKKEAMKVGLRQGAARNDIEIMIVDWKMPNGSPAIRVTKVLECIGLLRFAAAQADGKLTEGFSRKKYNDRIRRWRANKRAYLEERATTGIVTPWRTQPEDAPDS